MKLTMQQITHGEEEVIVKYLEKTPEIERLVSLIRAEDRRLIGWQEKVQTVLEPGRILYFFIPCIAFCRALGRPVLFTWQK